MPVRPRPARRVHLPLVAAALIVVVAAACGSSSVGDSGTGNHTPKAATSYCSLPLFSLGQIPAIKDSELANAEGQAKFKAAIVALGKEVSNAAAVAPPAIRSAVTTLDGKVATFVKGVVAATDLAQIKAQEIVAVKLGSDPAVSGSLHAISEYNSTHC